MAPRGLGRPSLLHFVDFADITNPTTTTTDTVIVGNGPSALSLSYLLHGNVPYYDSATHGPHPDPLLHQKLSSLRGRPLYEALQSPEACEALTDHFPAAAAFMSYSGEALPVNVLLDTLVQPNADTEVGEGKSRLRWGHDASKSVDHVVLGSAGGAGGQWAEDPISTGWDIETLSYAESLSLPGYSFHEHYRRKHGRSMPDLTRPPRREVAGYYDAYPRAVGIAPVVFSSVFVQRVSRAPHGFNVRAYRKRPLLPSSRSSGSEFCVIHCKHLVLATGIFGNPILPPPVLLPLLGLTTPLQRVDSPSPTLLVVGSGFTAADVILSYPSHKIIHIYQWSASRPSPLKSCHSQAYPEYAQIYRRMRQFATSGGARTHSDVSYEGFPNAQVVAVTGGVHSRIAKILTSQGDTLDRQVGAVKYCVGRRGSLEYLSDDLRKALGVADASCVSAETLRKRVERDMQVAKDVLVVGSLAGDSLVRYVFGGCVYAAGRIVDGRAAPVEVWNERGGVGKGKVWECVVT